MAWPISRGFSGLRDHASTGSGPTDSIARFAWAWPQGRVSAAGVRLRRVEVERFDKHLQQLLNSFEVPRRYTEAQTPGGIPVTARLAWAIDGEEWQVGSVMAWTQHLVLVHLSMEQRPQTRSLAARL